MLEELIVDTVAHATLVASEEEPVFINNSSQGFLSVELLERDFLR